jgi:nitroreductase
VKYDDFLELIKSRRTLRAIKPDPIADEMIGKLLEAARWAPTGFNMQPLEMLVPRARSGRARPGLSRPTVSGIVRWRRCSSW